jgi:purine nucleosidase
MASLWQEAESLKRLVIDTDTASDDATSLMLALRWPDVRVEAITTVAGNLPLQACTRNALYTVDLAAGRDVPVFPGADRPLLRDLVTCEEVHGQDGMGDSNFPPPRRAPEPEPAPAALVRLINRFPGELEIIAQAPLTNIALAYMLDPSIAGKVRRLWVMGGANNALGNVTPAAEFNFYVDPEAARIVFRAGFPITMVGWEICVRHTVFGPPDLAEIEAMGTPLARFYLEINRAVLRYNREHGGIEGTSHPDSVVAAMAVDSRVIRRSARCFVDIECTGELTRGYSLVDLLGVTGRAPNAEVCLEADRDRFRSMLFSVLRG